MAIRTCIFDAYGTLFDVTAAARLAAETGEFPALTEHWQKLAADWRDRQLQYTWIRALTGEHADFWRVTTDALDWALEASGLGGPDDTALRDRLRKLYWDLPAFPEVPDMLGALKDAGIATGILSNGSPEMLQAAVGSAGIGRLLDHVLSVESVGVYKPASQVYDLVGRAFDGDRKDILFVSANGWDAAAATGYGLPWRPPHVLDDLSALPALVEGL